MHPLGRPALPGGFVKAVGNLVIGPFACLIGRPGNEGGPPVKPNRQGVSLARRLLEPRASLVDSRFRRTILSSVKTPSAT